ncbi:MAG: DEAD/DEAH box helicase, partial [Nanoarchaeota archaeon]
MDEIQLTRDGKKLYFWGISSHSEEQFTPQERLKKIFGEIFPHQIPKFSKLTITIPTISDFIIAPDALKLAYGQYNDDDNNNNAQKVTSKKFQINAIEIELNCLIDGFLLSKKHTGFSFGDSYEGYKYIVKFAYNLIARQRFTPYYRINKSFFLVNLDSNEDFVLFKEICQELPDSITTAHTQEKEESLKEFLTCLTDVMVKEFIQDMKINISDATKSDAWIHGFFDEERNIDKELMQNISEWLVSRKVSKMHDYTILFKLEEPTAESSSWKLQYAVQSKKDPSLIIGLQDIWKNLKKIDMTNYKLHIIQELGMAARYTKIIEKSLLAQHPSEALLSEHEAISFIKSDSFMLRDFGFVVQIPKITTAKLSSLRVIVNFKKQKQKTLKTSGTSGLSNSLFDFDYEIAIGEDIVLSKEEFYQLSSMKSGLVNINERWVEVNNEDVKKVLSFFEKKKQLSLSDVLYAGASEEVEFTIDVGTFHEPLTHALFSGQKLDFETPPSDFHGELRPYQKQGYAWLMLLRKLHFGGILADDMGLGKTIQGISYLLYLKTQAVERPSLIIAPTSVIGNWERELSKFAPTLNVHLYHSSLRKKSAFKEQINGKDIIITSYGTIRNDIEAMGSISWDTIILDEAQNIKNPYTKQALAITKLSCAHRLCLSGTPIENRLSELWSLFNFSNPGLLSSWEKFRKKFANPIELDSNPEKTQRLKKIISPFILRRLKTDKSIIDDLPEKTEIKEYCTLTEEQATLYQAILDESLLKIKDSPEERRMHILATIIKLKQVCNHPTNFLKDTTTKFQERSGKIERLCEMVEVCLENDEKCLIFTQFKEMGDILKQVLEDYFGEQILFLHGQTNRKERERMITLFQNEKKPKIFVLSLKAGGLGIN